jgi:hypothetical protein
MTVPQALFYLSEESSASDKKYFKRFKRVGSIAEAINVAENTKR